MISRKIRKCNKILLELSVCTNNIRHTLMINIVVLITYKRRLKWTLSCSMDYIFRNANNFQKCFGSWHYILMSVVP